MTIKEEILEELRRGKPLAEIKEKFRSKSQLYEAIRQFTEEADKIVGEKQETLSQVQKDLLETKADLERKNLEKEEAGREIGRFDRTIKKKNMEVAAKVEELDSLRAAITELRAKGFTPEILKKIKSIESRSGPELWTQIRTVEVFLQIEKSISSLKRKKDSLIEEVHELETKKRKIEKKLASKRNQLDELKMRGATHREGIAIVCSLFRNGYSTKDIRSLKHGIEMLGINGDPKLSIDRLVRGLAKYRDLLTLQDRIAERKKEYAKLGEALVDARTELRVAKQLTKAFEEVKNAGVEAIANTAKQSRKTIESEATEFETYMKRLRGEFDAHIKETMERVARDLGEWGEVQQQKGKHEEILNLGYILHGVLNSPEYLMQVPLHFIVRLYDKLYLWSEINLQKVRISPSQNISSKDYRLSAWQSYEITVLIELVNEGLKKILVENRKRD